MENGYFDQNFISTTTKSLKAFIPSRKKKRKRKKKKKKRTWSLIFNL